MSVLHSKNTLFFKQAILFVWKSAPRWTLANAAITLVQGSLPLLVLYMMKLIIDAINTGINTPDKILAFQDSLFYIIVTGFVFLVLSLSRVLATLVKSQQTQHASDYMYNILHIKSSELNLEYYENPAYHNILHRARSEAPFRPTRIVSGLVKSMQSAISLILVAFLLVNLHWGVSLILFIATAPGVLVRLKYSKKMYDWTRQRTETERKTKYLTRLITAPEAIKELQLYGLFEQLIKKFSDLRVKLRGEKMRIITKRAVAELFTQITSALAIFVSYSFIAYYAINGRITMGDTVMYFLAFQRGLLYLRDLLSGLAALYEDNLFLSNLFEFLELPKKIVSEKNAKKFPKRIQKEISFKQVSFTYPGSSRLVLKNISFEIKTGETVAIVGENGAGKTTLIKLLSRFYDVQTGEILIDNENIKNIQHADLQKHIGIIFQDYVRYYFSVKENIAFGDIEKPLEEKAIETAAKKSNAFQFIENLPHKMDTILGKEFENGEELSTGEWQKIALARAFYRDSPLIILDEPASSLDPKSEYEIFEKFKQLTENKTAIIISHRYSTVKMADRIFVLSGAEMVEQGSHQELMAKNGKYAQMYTMQATRYGF